MKVLAEVTDAWASKAGEEDIDGSKNLWLRVLQLEPSSGQKCRVKLNLEVGIVESTRDGVTMLVDKLFLRINGNVNYLKHVN